MSSNKKQNVMPHPKWCNYFVTGWSLVDVCWGVAGGYVEKQGIEYCKGCDELKKEFRHVNK